MIFSGSVFDFFDGFVARLLKVNNPIGKDLDSLADIVTFGLLPTFIVYKLISNPLLSYLAFFIVIFSALRLANFNNDPDQKFVFRGLPTPALAIFFASYQLSISLQHFDFLSNDYLLVLLAVFFAFMLVLPVRMMSLKFTNKFSFADNWYRYIFIVVAILFILIWKFLGIGLLIVFYVLYSFVILRF